MIHSLDLSDLQKSQIKSLLRPAQKDKLQGEIKRARSTAPVPEETVQP